ncbi:hypothetical protein, conserved [Eimeria brunetti]|uniref:Uncharacterized protein n=1 Tax=Eimeria brunetti TaxID=51314 RepID=U6LKU2_9EIME|nr:hypothetical protein, conserved [Eimeria brunetti]
MAFRARHLPFAAGALTLPARELLQRARVSKPEPEAPCPSALQQAVSLGPYTVDFAQPLTEEELQQQQQQQQQQQRQLGLKASLLGADGCWSLSAAEELKVKAVVVEVDGPQHFYRDSLHW